MSIPRPNSTVHVGLQARSPISLRERLWLLAAIVLVPVAVFFQQFSLSLRSQTLGGAPAEKLAIEEVYEPGVAEFTIASKLAVKQMFLARRSEEEPAPAAEVMRSLEQSAITRAERLRLALVAAEIVDTDDALRRLAKLRDEVTPGGELAMDILWFTRLYAQGPDAVTPEARDALVQRHGWFARLALTHGEPAALRRKTVGSRALISFSAGLNLVFLGMLLVGVVVVLVAFSHLRNRLFQFRLYQSDRGPVYLELFTLFVGGFSLLVSANLIFFGFDIEGTGGAMVAQEILLWVLALTLLWPLLRNVPWARYTWDLGLHRGQGFFKEVLAGVMGWLASAPIMLGLAILMGLITGGGEDEAPTSGYPLFESPRGSSWLFVIVGMMSAVLWAPLIEEIVFRGAIQRYLRPWLKWWGAILVTALLFGLIHPYTPSGLVSVAVSGILLGFLREWRGSLVAPITAHLLHNGMITAVTLGLLVSLE